MEQIRRSARVLLLAALLSAAGAARAEIRITAEPAWNGVARAGAATEVRLQVTADRGGPAQIRLQPGGGQHGGRYRVSAQLGAETIHVLTVPIGSASDQDFELNVHNATGSATVPVRLTPVPPNRHHVAYVDMLIDKPPHAAVPTFINVASLPWRTASYAAVDAVAIDGTKLAALNRQQALALQDHLAACGNLVLVTVAPTIAEALRERAGCEGRGIAIVNSPAATGPALTRLLARSSAHPPGVAELSGLFPADVLALPARLMLMLVGAYLAFLLVGSRARLQARYLLGTSVAVAVLAGVLRFDSGNSATWLTWAEADATSQRAAVISLLQVAGGYHGTREVSLKESQAHLQPVPMADFEVRYDQDNDSYTLAFETRLLESKVFAVTGTTAINTALQWTIEAGRPVARNRGATPSAPVLLAWDDAKYRVPALAPGAQWQIDTNPESWQDRPAERLFRARALRLNGAVLMDRGAFTADAAPRSPDKAAFAGAAGGKAGADYLMIRL